MTTYQRASSSGEGYSLRYELTGPSVLHPDGRGATEIHKAEQAAVRAAGAQAQRKAIGAYSPEVIKKGWKLSTRTVSILGITVFNEEPLALWVEEPTKPHIIRARVKKALFWEGAAHPVRGVQHPGTPGKHRLPQLLEHLGRAFEAQIAKRVTPLLEGADTSPGGGFDEGIA